MKKLIIIVLSSTVFYPASLFSQSTDTLVSKFIESRLTIVKKFVSDPNSVISTERQNAVSFLMNLTGIEIEAGIDYLGQLFPSKTDLRYWRIWYDRNKNYLSWDNEHKAILMIKTTKPIVSRNVSD